MMDGWTKKAPDGKTIVFKKEGDKGVGFVYTAEGRMVMETSDMQEDLTREQVEEHFADYVNGPKPATGTVQLVAKCSHCGKALEFEVFENSGELGNYGIECPNPDCKKSFMRLLPGKIVSGPRPRNV
jgi:hypothetical protein